MTYRVLRMASSIVLMLAATGLLQMGRAEAKSTIDNVLVVSEQTDLLVLEVHYTYDGRGKAEMRAYMMQGDAVSRHHAYTPGRVTNGRHRTRVELVPNREAPKVFSSDHVRITMNVPGNARPVASRTYDYAKTWAKPRTPLRPVSTVVPARRGRVVTETPAGAPLQIKRTPSRIRLELMANARRSGDIAKIGGFKTPSGTTVVYSHAQPSTPPDEAPDLQHELWARSEANRLLGIIGTLLGNDAGALNWYKTTEGGETSPYGLISKRAEAIAVMVADEQ